MLLQLTQYRQTCTSMGLLFSIRTSSALVWDKVCFAKRNSCMYQENRVRLHWEFAWLMATILQLIHVNIDVSQVRWRDTETCDKYSRLYVNQAFQYEYLKRISTNLKISISASHRHWEMYSTWYATTQVVNSCMQVSSST